MSNFQDLKAAMIQAARRAYSIRLQSGDGGNLSVRIPGKSALLIKRSGCSFGQMSDDHIIAVGFDGKVFPGETGIPSREIGTHLEIYKSRPDISAIFHCHAPWSTACSICFDQWPEVSLPLDMKIGSVPVIDAGEGHADEDVIKEVHTLLNNEIGLKAFVQRRHGIFCMAGNIIKAEHDAELVEEAAQIAMLVQSAGKIRG